MRLPRRALLQQLAAATAAAALSPRRALAEPALPTPPLDLDVRDFRVEGDKALGRRFVLLTPKHLGADEKVPLLVLLHGLGETTDERLGAFAWLERYGLGTAYDRLRRPPVARISKHGYFPDPLLAAVNAELAQRPFKGLAIACPFTPNVQKMARGAALDGYTRWLCEVVIPRARREAPVIADAAHTGLDGVSLGGYIGFEVFSRRPEMFGAWGGVQAAIMTYMAEGYASKLASIAASSSTPPHIHLETSEADPYREANELLAKLLAKKSVKADLLVLPGHHNQPFLREAGTLEMLRWHDRRLRP